ncbi:MAG: DUF4157 domain-containing protein [Chloroflexota bacterium]
MSERQYMNENAQQKARKPENNVPDAAPEVNDLVRLQGVVGNQGVQRLLAQRKLIIQPKLNVTPAGDKYEQEADSVAQQVVKQINQPQVTQGADVQRAGEEDELAMKRIQRAGEEDELSMKRIQRAGEEDELSMKRIQRAGEEDELSMKRDTIQRDEGGEMEDEELSMKRIQRESFEQGGDVGGDIESSIEAARGSGSAMDGGIRGKLEGAFGADFSDVRVHTDAQSDSLNKSIQAKAFTTGSDIFFSKGAYDPGSQSGQELLGHELTHVVQQGSAVQKKQDE